MPARLSVDDFTPIVTTLKRKKKTVEANMTLNTPSSPHAASLCVVPVYLDLGARRHQTQKAHV
jgi:hypothetical protein